jgi:hypothetical protein
MRHARQRQSQVCGVHGRASSGLGQQLHVRPLSNPDPGARAISPGRRVVRRLTRPHRPWPACQAPTNPPRRRARPSRNRIAHPPYAPAVGPAGHGLDAANGPRRNGRRVLDHTPAPGRQAGTRPRPPYARRRVPPCPSAGQPLPGAAQDISGNAGMCSSTAMPRAAWALAGLAQQQSGWSRGHEQS